MLETELHRRGEGVVFGGIVLVMALLCGVTILFAAPPLLDVVGGLANATPSPPPNAASAPGSAPTFPALGEGIPGASATATRALPTNTPPPTQVMATVTLAPPTATITPTPGPCTQEVRPGDTLVSMASRCGHRDWGIIDVILELNDSIDEPESLQIGQQIVIPWPTPTFDPNALPTPNEDTSSAAVVVDAASLGFLPTVATDDGPPSPTPTETLLPGVMWHTVQSGETMDALAFRYNAGAEVLSQLNPEITFSQCDFGEFTGGETCEVILRVGQRVRVPAPTPLPTLVPTLSGSETPTPSPTATFNAPSLTSPQDRRLFRSSERVTLRWIPTGTLGPREVYRVWVDDLTSGRSYTDDTTEPAYVLPTEWQGSGVGRYDYRWRISVVNLDNAATPIFTTSAWTFAWEGAGVGN
ncbi:MAG: LysM peptidoglycan-binding domain-containing protein [Chloroflexi bacterium]|nr:LysM peptidoglycan-binding domain-containing protein [Chloroflexota bacterium]